MASKFNYYIEVVDVSGLESELSGIPLAEIAVVVVEGLFVLLSFFHQDRHVEDLEANGTLQMPHAEVILIRSVVSAHFI